MLNMSFSTYFAGPQDHGYPTARHEQKGVSQVGMKPVNMEIHSTAGELLWGLHIKKK